MRPFHDPQGNVVTAADLQRNFRTVQDKWDYFRAMRSAMSNEYGDAIRALRQSMREDWAELETIMYQEATPPEPQPGTGETGDQPT